MKTAIAAALFVLGAAAWSIEPAEIVRRMEENQVHKTSEIEGSFTIEDSFGSRVKTFKAFSMGEDKMRVEFTNPEEAGQKILRTGDEIYLYYPEAEEVIHLQGSGLKDSVMGSDFSYEDFTGEKGLLNLYTVELEGTESVDGRECFVLKLSAKKKQIAYAQERMWVDSGLYVVRKAVFFSVSGKAVKEMEVTEIKTMSGKNIPMDMEMRDLMKKNSSTAFQIKKIKIDAPLDPKLFTLEELSW
jgi:outer membrane lipoprotein-sorting protein